jgi:hypothetical protein
VSAHEGDQPLGGAFAAPRALALCVVGFPLVDRCIGELRENCRCADVIGMEVRDDNSFDGRIKPLQGEAPAIGGIVDAKAGVDDRPRAA